jgi:hypothetical protein
MKTVIKAGDNLGGLIKIWAIPADALSVSGSEVTIVSDTNVYQIYCSPDSMEFNEPKEVTGAGTHYNTVVGGFVPQDNATLQEALEYIEPRKWVVLFIDGNGNYKLAGTPTNPLRFNAELTSGADTTGRAGCRIQFFGKTLARALFVNNPFA